MTMTGRTKSAAVRLIPALVTFVSLLASRPGCLAGLGAVRDDSPLGEKAASLERDLLQKHWLDGLYVSIVPRVPQATRLTHSVDEPGNVIHAGVWTGRYLAGVGYQYAVTRDPQVRSRGGEILRALRILQEVTGKPGLLARGYMKGHGPVAEYERDGNDAAKWHQGQGPYAGYRWYSDVSVDNFNAVLYGYAIYYDLAADDKQKQFIAHDVDRLMTHLLDNHCRLIDVDGKPTEWGHVGIDPDPSRDEYYREYYRTRFGRRRRTETRANAATSQTTQGKNGQSPSPAAATAPGSGAPGAGSPTGSGRRMSLRSELLLLPDLLIAHHITGKDRYRDMYRRVIERFKPDAGTDSSRRPRTPEQFARRNHSAEGQAYEALFNLIRYERDPALLAVYRTWLGDLWDVNWNELNPLFTYMTCVLWNDDVRAASDARPQSQSDPPSPASPQPPHRREALEAARKTLELYPVDRVMRPVMNSLRKEIELNPYVDRHGHRQALKPLPINERPIDNEYAWKGSPYELDGWIRPTVITLQFACDDPQVAWFTDSSGGAYVTFDHGQTWQSITTGLMGAAIRRLVASKDRTFVLWADCDKGLFVTRDGGLSWRPVRTEDSPPPPFPKNKFGKWLPIADSVAVRISKENRLERTTDGGKTTSLAMQGWRIPIANTVFRTPWGIIASGPGGVYCSSDTLAWKELTFGREYESGAADFLHVYWLGRYYGFIEADATDGG